VRQRLPKSGANSVCTRSSGRRALPAGIASCSRSWAAISRWRRGIRTSSGRRARASRGPG
jgi:hypothetical protein